MLKIHEKILGEFGAVGKGAKVIVFGSVAKGNYRLDSDIDIAVIVENMLESKIELERQIFPLLKRLSKKYKKEIEAHYFHESDLNHKEDPLSKDIVRNGILLA